jgi:predicted dehydrogenase
MPTDRRTFLASSLAVAASAQRVVGANDRVNIVVIGLGGRGMDHVKQALQIPGFRIAGLCDVNQAARERASAEVMRAGQEKPKEYIDMRDAFADKAVDAVTMATPNHWHALGTIWACQAGKDVYVEKPASHNIFEGQQMVAAARKYNRMVQVGSHKRSMPHLIEAMELLKQGEIGKLYMAKGLCYKRRKSIGRSPDLAQVPPGIDWDRFLGPAPMRPFNELRFKYNWHWFWDTGNGDIGNQGVHEMDIAMWGLGQSRPSSVYSTGGKFAYDDMQETPNTQQALFNFDQAEMQFEVRGLMTNEEAFINRKGYIVGDLFFGTEGWMQTTDDGYLVFKGDDNIKVKEGKRASGNDLERHLAGFLKAVHSRKIEDLTAEIAIGVEAANLCHMANISYRTASKLQWDTKSGRFVNNPEANKLISREYRKPYVVPEKV